MPIDSRNPLEGRLELPTSVTANQERDRRDVVARMRYWPPELRVLAGVTHARTYKLPYVYRWEETQRGWFRVVFQRVLVVTLPDNTLWKIETPEEPLVISRLRRRKLDAVLSSKDHFQ